MNAEALEQRFGHAWRRATGIGEAGVSEFERVHGITLPEPYREFVSDVANGAAGPPDYGLVAIGECELTESDAVRRRTLGRQFPLTEPWVWEGEEHPDPERLDATYHDGTLYLGTDGCAMDYVLVVTGEARGQVWMVADGGAQPVADDFGRWIEGDVPSYADWTRDPGTVAPVPRASHSSLAARIRRILTR